MTAEECGDGEHRSIPLEYNDEWWKCPECGAQTKIVRDENETRTCIRCDWSVKVNIPEDFIL